MKNCSTSPAEEGGMKRICHSFLKAMQLTSATQGCLIEMLQPGSTENAHVPKKTFLFSALSQSLNTPIIVLLSMEKKYRFAGYAMLLLVPLTFAGFYKSYFESFPQFSDRINLYDHIHAAAATAWLALLVIQPLLIANKKYAAHRTVGKLSYIIFSLFILSFIPQVFKTMRSGNTKALFFPLADGALLIALYLLAVYNKKNTPRHMRYMIASALVLLSPTAGRILPIFFGWGDIATQNFLYILDLSIFISLILLDRDIKKSQPYLVAAALFLLHAIGFYWVF